MSIRSDGPAVERTSVDWAEVHARVEEASRRLAATHVLTPEEAERVLQERARALARPPAPEPDAGAVRQFLLATIGGQRVGIPAELVFAVLRDMVLTPLPGATPPVVAIVASRGRLLACLDLASALGAAPAEAGEHRRLVILGRMEAELALAIDSVEELTELAVDAIHPVPAGAAGDGGLLLGITSDAMPLLDVAALLRRHGVGR